MRNTFLILILALLTNSFSVSAKIKLTFPSETDVLVAGTDTLITWAGIPETDTISIEYSPNYGKDWILLSEEEVGHKYLWENIPKVSSTERCIIKLKQNKNHRINMNLLLSGKKLTGVAGGTLQI